eukprot:Skav225248  [mRNA]  locus=scaffold988:18606:27195:- [translate_table: standard]
MTSRGSDRKHVMLSGRFDRPEIIKYIKDVKRGLDEKGVATYMVQCREGEDFSEATMEGLGGAWAMIVFGTSEYGAWTGAGYETYEELRFAHQKKLPLFPIQLCERWPPEPRDRDGGRKGQNQNLFVLRDTVIRLSDPEMKKPQEIAEKLAERLLGTKDREFVLQPSFFELVLEQLLRGFGGFLKVPELPEGSGAEARRGSGRRWKVAASTWFRKIPKILAAFALGPYFLQGCATPAWVPQGLLQKPDRDSGNAAIFLAAADAGDVAAVRHFICADSGAVHWVDGEGRTAMHVAGYAGHVEVLSALAAAGADLEKTTNRYRWGPRELRRRRWTPLHWAADQGRVEVAKVRA